jgi:hypothetical protein
MGPNSTVVGRDDRDEGMGEGKGMWVRTVRYGWIGQRGLMREGEGVDLLYRYLMMSVFFDPSDSWESVGGGLSYGTRSISPIGPAFRLNLLY